MTWLPFAAVSIQRAVEVPALTVDVDVQRVKGCTALGQCFAHHVGHVTEQFPCHRARHRSCASLTMQPGPPQRLICIDVAHTGHQRLIQQCTLDSGVLEFESTQGVLKIELRVERIERNMPNDDGHLGLIEFRQQHAAKDPLIHKPPLSPIVKIEHDPGMAMQRSIRIGDQRLPAHTEMNDQCGTVIKDQPQIFATSPRSEDAAAPRAFNKVGRTRRMPTQRTRIKDLNAGHLAADDMVAQAEADNFNFGQFGHSGSRLDQSQ